MSTSIDTSSIGYNYSIMYSLFYSKNKNVIDKEVTKLINDQIDLMIAFKQNDSAVEQLKFIVDKFFVYSSILGKEQGQLGMPQIKDHGVYKPVVSIDELKNRYIARKSIHLNTKVKKGDVIIENMLIPLRPCVRNSYSPDQLSTLIKKKSIKNIKAGECITKNLVH